MNPNYQPPAHLDVSKLTIRQPSARLNTNNNDSDPGGHPPKLHGGCTCNTRKANLQ